MKQNEALIQAEIVKALRQVGIVCHSVPNEQSHGNPVRTGQLIAMGLLHGVADLVFWYGDGKAAYMEVKTTKGRQSDYQIAFEGLCKKHGFPYRVVRNKAEAMKFVQELKPEGGTL